MTLGIEDRTAIVTGAARGIGLATVRRLAEHGARVVAVDRDADELADAMRELDDASVARVTVDLLDEAAPTAIVDAAIEHWGAIDIVVNNAGFTADAPMHKLSDEQWDAMLAIHATVPFRLLRAAAPHLREPAKAEQAAGIERSRKVVNVTSTSGTMGNATQANYAAGKAAVVGLTKTLAKEWGPLKVNVNAVAFGFIETRLTDAVPEHLRGMAEMLTPLGRAGTPDEAAGAILFLCSDLSNFVTGQVLTVSGGLPLGMSS
jgi:3-oxoacyl-[acyl-carrier protein] reductase